MGYTISEESRALALMRNNNLNNKTYMSIDKDRYGGM